MHRFEAANFWNLYDSNMKVSKDIKIVKQIEIFLFIIRLNTNQIIFDFEISRYNSPPDYGCGLDMFCI